jgi:hypothetical protein
VAESESPSGRSSSLIGAGVGGGGTALQRATGAFVETAWGAASLSLSPSSAVLGGGNVRFGTTDGATMRFDWMGG